MRLRLPETCLSRVSERTEKNSTEGCFLSCGTYCNPLSQFTIVEHAFARGGVIHFTASEQVEQVTTRKNRVGMPGRPEADSHVSVLPPTELLLSCLQLCKNGGGVHFFTTSKVERDNACLERSPSLSSLAGSTGQGRSTRSTVCAAVGIGDHHE